jgi:hypothetical protein
VLVSVQRVSRVGAAGRSTKRTSRAAVVACRDYGTLDMGRYRVRRSADCRVPLSSAIYRHLEDSPNAGPPAAVTGLVAGREWRTIVLPRGTTPRRTGTRRDRGPRRPQEPGRWRTASAASRESGRRSPAQVALRVEVVPVGQHRSTSREALDPGVTLDKRITHCSHVEHVELAIARLQGQEFVRGGGRRPQTLSRARGDDRLDPRNEVSLA